MSPLDIAVETTHQLPGLGGCEEAERHALQVLVELASEIEDDPLAHVRRPPALDHPDQGAHDGDHDHAQPEQGQLSNVTLACHRVDEPSHQYGRHNAQAGDDEDRDQDPDQTRQIGTAVRPDAPE